MIGEYWEILMCDNTEGWSDDAHMAILSAGSFSRSLSGAATRGVMPIPGET